MQPEGCEQTLDAGLREALKHVYWIGGGSGAGKSTIARSLVEQHNLYLYGTDEVMSNHAARMLPEDAPYLSRFKRMDMDERWLDRSPETMLETFHWFRGEGFGLIVDDLLRMPVEPSVIAEGIRLLPDLVKPLLADVGHAVWLLPTPEFRLTAVDSRNTGWEFLDKTSDPERARRNLVERDRMFTDQLLLATKRLGLASIVVDPSITVADLTCRVEKAFGL